MMKKLDQKTLDLLEDRFDAELAKELEEICEEGGITIGGVMKKYEVEELVDEDA